MTVGLALAGCAPANDWREVRPEGAGVAALFPCRPEHYMRSINLPAAAAPMHLLVCRSARATFAIGYLDVSAPSEVSGTLVALRRAAAISMSANELSVTTVVVPGMTPNPQAKAIVLRGRSAQGASIESRVALIARGLRVYQATVFAEEIDSDAAETFFAALRLL
jgi:hypothetical protein